MRLFFIWFGMYAPLCGKHSNISEEGSEQGFYVTGYDDFKHFKDP